MKRFQISIGYIIVMIFCSTVFAEQRFIIMTEKNPPFNFEQDGAVHGIGADLFMLLMEKIGQPMERSAIKIMSWDQAYKIVQEEPGTILFSMARTEQREKLFAWVGPIYDLQIGLIASKSKKIIINKLENAKKYKIGTIRGGAPEQIVIQGGIDPETLDRSDDPVSSIKKLAAGQIDMFAFNVPATHYIMIQQGVNTTDFELVFQLKTTGLYYSFHKDTDSAFIEKMNQALLRLKQTDRNGKSPYGEIIAKYLSLAAYNYSQNIKK